MRLIKILFLLFLFDGTGGSGGSGGDRHQEGENTVQHAHDAARNASVEGAVTFLVVACNVAAA